MNKGVLLHIHTTEMALSAVLREQRESLGLTRREVVERFLPRIGVSLSDRTLLSYERLTKDQSAPLRPVTVRRILELATAYEVPASTLLREAEIRAGHPPQCRACGRPLE